MKSSERLPLRLALMYALAACLFVAGGKAMDRTPERWFDFVMDLTFILVSAIAVYLLGRVWDHARTRGAQALRESEERWQLAALASDQALWEWNVPRDHLWMSSRGLEMLGFAGRASPGPGIAQWAEWFHPDDRERVRMAIDDHLSRKAEAFNSQHRMMRPDGRVLWVVLRARIVYDAKGFAQRMVGTLTDESGRRVAEIVRSLAGGVQEGVLAERLLRDNLAEFCAAAAAELELPLVWVGLKRPEGRVEALASGGSAQVAPDDIVVYWNDGPEGRGPVGRAIRLGRWQSSAVGDPDYGLWRGLAERHLVDALLAVPLVNLGQTVGVLVLGLPRRDHIDTDFLARMEELAAGLGLAVMAAATRERMALRESALQTAANAVFICDAQGNIVWTNRAMERLSGYDAEEMWGRDPRMFLSGGQDPQFFEQLLDTLQGGESVRGDFEYRRKGGEFQVVSQTITPIRDETGTIAHYVAILEDAGERRQSEERLYLLARQDPVTSLGNRLLFHERLQGTLQRSVGATERLGTVGGERVDAPSEVQPFAVLFVDLDHFKHINDTLGHEVGDAVLREAAARFLAVLSPGDLLCRMGGDEFAILAHDIREPGDTERLARKLLAAMDSPLAVDGRELLVTISIGVTVCPQDATDGAQLLRNADLAMFQAKRQGRNGMCFFSGQMNRLAVARGAVVTGLRKAIAQGQLRAHFQPQFDLRESRIIGAEALVRWQHPEQGLLAPARFIEAAEELDMIAPLGEWMLREACREAARWSVSEADGTGLRVGVNVSLAQFQRSNLVAIVESALKDAGLPGHRLELELTESVLAHDHVIVGETLKKLKTLGVRVAVDDFGTGWSSYRMVREFPVDTLKIDQSFVRVLERERPAEAIIQSTLTLAHGLGLNVVAEGVETPEQLARLQAMGCREVQGFLLARPMTGERFREWLRDAPTHDLQQLMTLPVPSSPRLRTSIESSSTKVPISGIFEGEPPG